MRSYIGIDPGENGGLVCLDNGCIVFSTMPDTEAEIWDWIRGKASWDGCPHCGPHCDLAPKPREVVAVIEEISGSFFGSAKGSVSKLFGSYTALRMALTAAGIPFQSVKSAKMWRALGIPPRKMPKWGKGEKPRKPTADQVRAAGGEPPSDWKQRLLRKAEELFPQLKIDLSVSDSLLVAYYCRLTNQGDGK